MCASPLRARAVPIRTLAEASRAQSPGFNITVILAAKSESSRASASGAARNTSRSTERSKAMFPLLRTVLTLCTMLTSNFSPLGAFHGHRHALCTAEQHRLGQLHLTAGP